MSARWRFVVLSVFCLKYMRIGCKLHLRYSPAGIHSVGNTTHPFSGYNALLLGPHVLCL